MSGERNTLPDTDTSENLSEQEVRAELDRLLQSALFLQSDRLGRFLRFAIENALAGNTDLLKEYVIGTEVYDRKPPYHPSQDSIVRTEARRLRAKLKEYYESEGKQNPVFIYFRPGTYVPVFRRNESLAGPSSDRPSPESELLVKGVGVAVAVLPFVDLSNRPLSSLCAQGVTEELIHGLSHADGIRVIARPAPPQPVEAPYDIPSLSQKFGLSTVIEGTVREDHNRLRITARVLGSDGFQMSSHRFDTEATAEVLAPGAGADRHRLCEPGASGAVACAPAKGCAERPDAGGVSPFCMRRRFWMKDQRSTCPLLCRSFKKRGSWLRLMRDRTVESPTATLEMALRGSRVLPPPWFPLPGKLPCARSNSIRR